MSSERAQELEAELGAANLGWALKGDPAALERILGRLDDSSREYERRFGTPVDLHAACRAESAKMRAFLQTLAAGVSPGFLAMVARVLLRGAEVAELHVDFISLKSMALRVVLKDPDGRRHAFESTELWDAQVLHHFGLMEAGAAPVIDGYYSMRD